jgi:hypothetical protein
MNILEFGNGHSGLHPFTLYEEILCTVHAIANNETKPRSTLFSLGTYKKKRFNGMSRRLRIGSTRIPEDTHRLLADLS